MVCVAASVANKGRNIICNSANTTRNAAKAIVELKSQPVEYRHEVECYQPQGESARYSSGCGAFDVIRP